MTQGQVTITTPKGFSIEMLQRVQKQRRDYFWVPLCSESFSQWFERMTNLSEHQQLRFYDKLCTSVMSGVTSTNEDEFTYWKFIKEIYPYQKWMPRENESPGDLTSHEQYITRITQDNQAFTIAMIAFYGSMRMKSMQIPFPHSNPGYLFT